MKFSINYFNTYEYSFSNNIFIDKTPKSSANIYLFKVNNRNSRKRCEVCSKLTIKTPERRQWRHSGVFIVNFEHTSSFSNVSIVYFEKVNVSRVNYQKCFGDKLNYLYVNSKFFIFQNPEFNKRCSKTTFCLLFGLLPRRFTDYEAKEGLFLT